MRKFLILAILVLPLSTFGQSLAGVNGDCQIGGQQTLTSGLPSTGTQQIGTSNVNQGAGVQASFPSCRVTVYATGTTNKAAIYSNNNPSPSVLSNPFTANTDGSYTFFISQGACYDILISSGSVTMPYSRTLADVCVGTGSDGGGGGGLGPFTVNRLIKAATTSTLSSATCLDDGVFPTSCSTGLNLVGSALLESKSNNSSTGTTANLLIARDSSGNAINAQPTDQNNIIGVAAFNAGTTGSVTYAVAGNFPLLFENQTGIGDYVTLGSTSQGHDSGATQPAGRNYGRITSVNAGPGTLANVDLDMSSNGGTSSGGSGIVSSCSGVGGVFYAQATGTTASCDILFTTDGAGNVGLSTLTTHGPSDGNVQVFDSNGAADNSLLITSSGGDSEIEWLSPTNAVIGDIAFRNAFQNLRLESQAATSARQVSLVVESDPTEIASGCPLGTQQGCILTDSPNTSWAVGQGPAASHTGGLQWKGNTSGATWVGVPDVAGGGGGGNYILWPTASGTVSLTGTTYPACDASTDSSTDWIAGANAAISGGCTTIIIPHSLQGTSSTTFVMGTASLHIHFGCGIFKTNNELAFAVAANNNKLEVDGDGACSVLWLNASSINGLHFSGVPNTTVADIHVHDMWIYADPSLGTAAAAAIYMDGVSNFNIDHMTIDGNSKLVNCLKQRAGQQGEFSSSRCWSITGSGVDAGLGTGVASNTVEYHALTIDCTGIGSTNAFLFDSVDDAHVHDNNLLQCDWAIKVTNPGFGINTFNQNHIELMAVGAIQTNGPTMIIANSIGDPVGTVDVQLLSGAKNSTIAFNLLDRTVTMASGAKYNNVFYNDMGGSGTITDSDGTNNCYNNQNSSGTPSTGCSTQFFAQTTNTSFPQYTFNTHPGVGMGSFTTSPLYFAETGGTHAWYIGAAGSATQYMTLSTTGLTPSAANSYLLGSAANPFSNVFTNAVTVEDGTFGSNLTSTRTACETAFATTTLATGATTTDTGLNCLPANSIIDFVVARVTTTITAACTGWELGDAATPARFSSNNTTLAAGTTTDAAHIGTYNNTGIASATTGIWQASAAKVRITCAGGNPGAGAIRVIVYSHTPTAPTS